MGGPAPAARHEGTHHDFAFGLGSFKNLNYNDDWQMAATTSLALDILIDFKS